MGRKVVLLLLMLCAVTSVAGAQATNGRITGRVASADGNRPLAAATVIIAGTSRGTVTDSLGRFTLADIPPGSRTLQARRIGFISSTQVVSVTAGGVATVAFNLTPSPIQLAEVKTVGYGTQEARTVTGAIGSVSAEKIAVIPTSDPMKAIQGRIPGVEITGTNSEPGTAMQVRIRGVRSLRATNEPLFVVDGIPISGNIQDFNPQMIESVDVLKDAAATAIYGSRGANGVVLVTTKKGIQDGSVHSTYSLDSYYGAQQPLKTLNMMNMEQYVQLLKDGAVYRAFNTNTAVDTSITAVFQGASTVPTAPGSTVLIPKKYFAYINGLETDWFDTVLQDATQKSFQGSLLGSTPDTRYSASGTYFGQGGLIPGQGYRRGSGFASVDHTLGRLRVGLTGNGSRIYQDIGEGGQGFGFVNAMSPFGVPYNYTNPDSADLFDPRTDDDALNINPLFENQQYTRQLQGNRIFASAFAELKLFEGLTYRVNYGPDFNNTRTGCHTKGLTHGPCTNPGSFAGNGTSSAFLRNTYQFAYTLDNLLQLSKDLGSKQHLDGTLLYSIQHDRSTRDSISASNLPYSTQLWYDIGSGSTVGQQQSYLSEWGLQSYMGRAVYTLLDRYTVSATGRADGSSRLAPGHKWAFFPSVGLAWQIGDEPFLRGLSALNSLKLRGSYGTTGNTAIDPYSTQGLLAARVYSFGGTAVRGYRSANIPNPDLGWEKTTQSDIGLDFALFGNRFSGSVDTYVANTNDLLLPQALPSTSGFTTTLQNVGSTKNTGIEVGISTVNLQNFHGLTWSTDLNWTKQKNEITSLQSGATADLANVWIVGQPINLCRPGACGDALHAVWYDYKTEGVWQFADSLLMRQYNAAGSTFKPGQPRVADVNGDGRITVADSGIIGNSYPKWTGSLSNRFTLGGFDLSGLVTAKWDYLIQDNTPRGMNGRNGVAVLDYWTATNPTNANPAPQPPYSGGTWNYMSSLRYADGSHWRIRNVTLGYTAGESLAGKVGAQSLRIYGTAQDPYVHSNYTGQDPEVFGSAPTIRTFLVGTNIVW